MYPTTMLNVAVNYAAHDAEMAALRDQDVPLEDIRALPAKAGSIVCWSTSLLHWGARSSRRATQPRISMATYYQSRDVPPYHNVTMDIPSPIPFAYRIHLVEKVTSPQ